MANNVFWTGTDTKTINISNIINNEHLSYYNISVSGGVFLPYNEHPKRLNKTSTVSFSLNNNLPYSTSSQTYTISVEPIWYGDSKTYTNGNIVRTTFEVRQTNYPHWALNNAYAYNGHYIIWGYYDEQNLSSGIAGQTSGYASICNMTANGLSNAYDKSISIIVKDKNNVNLNSYFNFNLKLVGGLYTVSQTKKLSSQVTYWKLKSNDPVGNEMVCSNIYVLNPEFIVSSNVIYKGDNLSFKFIDKNFDERTGMYPVPGATFSVSGASLSGNYVTASESSSGIILRADGPGGAYRSIYIKVIDKVQPIMSTTRANTGDNVSFTLKIGDIDLLGVDNHTSGTQLTTSQINSAFSVSNCQILSVTSDGSNWNGIIHLNGNGGQTANVTTKFKDNTSTTSVTGIKIEDITLILS